MTHSDYMTQCHKEILGKDSFLIPGKDSLPKISRDSWRTLIMQPILII